MNTPTAAVIHDFLYGGSREDQAHEHDIDVFDAQRLEEVPEGAPKRPSIYLEAFEDMIRTVCDYECHLISRKEMDFVIAFSSLCYNARYCLVRLLLRKPDTWHTLASMESYTKEVGREGLVRAMEDLSRPVSELLDPEHVVIKEEGPEVIDLTFMSDTEDEKKPIIVNAEAGPSKLTQSNFFGPSEHKTDIKPSLDSLERPEWESNYDFFCEDDTCMTLEEVLGKLTGDQLRELVRDMKVKPQRLNKGEMISALLIHASTQSVLSFTTHTKGKKKGAQKSSGDGLRQTTLPFAACGKKKVTRRSQEERLMQMALNMLGKSYRVNLDLYLLVVRFNVIYERSIAYPKTLLLPSLLTSFKKRTYHEYKHRRSANIWGTREELLEYVEALRIEAAIEHELEPPPPGRLATKTPVPNNNKSRFVTPRTPAPRSRTTPLRTPKRMSTLRLTESPLCKKGKEKELEGGNEEEKVAEVPIKIQQARNVKEAFDEKVFPRWKELVAVKKELQLFERTPGLERFEPGFVYTRIFSKAMRAMATLQAYEAEAEALEALLGQRRWRRGKRARWYERRAVLQTRYLCWLEGSDGKEKDFSVLQQAMEGVKEALQDEDTGLILRPSLVRRLRTLEKQLKVRLEDRCQCEGELRKANSVSFSAERVYSTDSSLKLDANGRPIKSPDTGVLAYFPKVVGKGEVSVDKENKPNGRESSDGWKWKGKSLWRGIDGEEVNVETRALQYYEGLGYKGFHSESRILTTIFALLFWDIIFADVPGAFETPYQTAPLDLTEDSFYRARKKEIEARLEEIQHRGRALEIIAEHDERYREKKTWCVGVRWDICERQDLLEIVECLGGESLSMICRLFCEDYAGRSSGVPDLIVWNPDEHLCKFVEVKGPGDRPQENQKLWFDSLLGAGADVEICRVLDANPPPPKKPKKKKPKHKIEDSDDVEMDMGVEGLQAWEQEEEWQDGDETREQMDDAEGGDGEDGAQREYATRSKSVVGIKRHRPPDEGDEVTAAALVLMEEEMMMPPPKKPRLLPA